MLLQRKKNSFSAEATRRQAGEMIWLRHYLGDVAKHENSGSSRGAEYAEQRGFSALHIFGLGLSMNFLDQFSM